MAPIARQGSTPASNSGPGSCRGCRRRALLPSPLLATGIPPQQGEGLARASKGVPMALNPFPGVSRFSPFQGCPGFSLSQLSSSGPGHFPRAPAHLHHPAEPDSPQEDAPELHDRIRIGHGPRAEAGRRFQTLLPPPKNLRLQGPGSKPQELCGELDRDQRFGCERGQGQEEFGGSGLS